MNCRHEYINQLLKKESKISERDNDKESDKDDKDEKLEEEKEKEKMCRGKEGVKPSPYDEEHEKAHAAKTLALEEQIKRAKASAMKNKEIAKEEKKSESDPTSYLSNILSQAALPSDSDPCGHVFGRCLEQPQLVSSDDPMSAQYALLNRYRRRH